MTSLTGADLFACMVLHKQSLELADIKSLRAERDALAAEVVRLQAELARREANEHRNCINWGPCSEHDGRMVKP